jgi:hypothetical protein
MGEWCNLKDGRPELVAELTAAAESWLARIEERWQREWLPNAESTTAHASR